MALDVILDLTSLDVFVKRCAARSALRLRELGLCSSAHCGHSIVEGDADGYLISASDHVMPFVKFVADQDVMLKRDEWVDGVPPFLSGVLNFTDDFKMDTGMGAGVYCEELRLNISLGLDKTIVFFKRRFWLL